MSGRLGITSFLTGTGNLDVPPRDERISFKSFRGKIFCQACNAHFKDLEDAAIPLLEHMALGWPVGLGLRSQRTLALWAAKTSVALLALIAPEIVAVIPMDHRRSIRYDGVPPDELWIAYLRWADTANEAYIWVSQGGVSDRDEGAPEDPIHTYHVIFAFRELAFMSVGFARPLPAVAAPRRDTKPMPRFWPPRGDILDWPPSNQPAAERSDIDELVMFNPLLLRA
jgi:hypothetical protein